MSDVSYLPSEISRLIYGYLQENCNGDVASSFLNGCESLKECQTRMQFGFDSKFQNQFSLTQILNQYAILSELIFQNVELDNGAKCSHVNIVHLLRKLLESRLSRLKEYYRKQATYAEEKSTTNLPNTSPKIGTNKEDAAKSSGTNAEEVILAPTIDCIEKAGFESGRSDFTQVHRTPRKDNEPPVANNSGDVFLVPNIPASVQQPSTMWDHSVQNILAEYSPPTAVSNQSETSNKKRKLEEIELENSGILQNVPTTEKRRKLKKETSCKNKRKIEDKPNKVPRVRRLINGNGYIVQFETSNEIELYSRLNGYFCVT